MTELTRTIKIARGHDIRYCIVGTDGAIDFHCSYPMSQNAIAGGLEVHYRRRPTYMKARPADFEQCHILGGPCWCDGTSLYATERLMPLFVDYVVKARGPEDEECWWKTLESEYRRRFDPAEISFTDSTT